MKYAINFYNGCRVLSQADEVILQYKEKHTSLTDYVQEYEDNVRVIVDITKFNEDAEDLSSNVGIWRAAAAIHPNFAIKLNFMQRGVITYLDDVQIPYFFSNRVNTLDTLYGYIATGVSDIYICDELGFNLKKISKFCKEKNVKVRIYPNIAQSSFCELEGSNTIRNFFIRPEDVEKYEPYVDVLEFYTDNLDKQSVLFNIYKDGKWLGDLSELILGLNTHITNISILPDFADFRINCKKDCECGGSCTMCDKIVKFTKITDEIREQSGYQFKVNKN